MMTDRAAEAVTLARETAAQRDEVGALIGEAARQAELAIARGTSAKAVAYWLIDANRLIGAAAQGQAAAI